MLGANLSKALAIYKYLKYLELSGDQLLLNNPFCPTGDGFDFSSVCLSVFTKGLIIILPVSFLVS